MFLQYSSKITPTQCTFQFSMKNVGKITVMKLTLREGTL